MNTDDVIGILHHHWVLCNDYYPEERQRLQHAVMNTFCASTTARAGIESSCYFGRNETVEYRDIELYALRDSEYPGGVKLGMLIQLRLLKGRRNRGNPVSFSNQNALNITTNWTALDRRSNSRSAMTTQAFVSSKLSWDSRLGTWAFASKWIRDPQDIYSIDIPDRLQSRAY
jgi:hypothetical protein